MFALGLESILSSGVLSCDAGTDYATIEKKSAVAEKTIKQVQAACTEKWMSIPGVEGTGIGLCEDKPCIKVFSSKPVEALKGKIPSVVDGYPVTIEATGTFRALE